MPARTKDTPLKIVKKQRRDTVDITIKVFLNKNKVKADRTKVFEMVHHFIDDRIHDVVRGGKTHADIHDIGSVCLICEGEVMEICV
jgi:hypothetical protein